MKVFGDNRMPHAMLFTGPEGIGKRMAAVVTAAMLNCENPSPEGACGICPSCIKLKAGTHPLIRFVGSPKNEKLLEVDFPVGQHVTISNLIPVNSDSKKKITQKINIDQIKEIIRESSLKSYGSGCKVFIIDDMSQSSIPAMNCLLKVLEEPPAMTYFILVTSREELLFPTIISRCQKFEFTPLTGEEMTVFCREKLAGYPDEGSITEMIPYSYGSPMRLLRYIDMKDIYFPETKPEEFFESVKKWFSDSTECIEKLNVLMELEGNKFRKSPSEKAYNDIRLIEDTINNVKKNINPDLAVSNMFIRMGRSDFGKRS